MKIEQRKKYILFLFGMLIVLTPFLAYSIFTTPQDMDPRSQAYDYSSSVKCQIKFLYVDPAKLQVNKPVTVELSSYTPGESTVNVELYSNESGTDTPIIVDDLPIGSEQFDVEFLYTPTTLGTYTIYGSLITDKSSYPCLLAMGNAATARVVEQNEPPAFTTSPPNSATNNISVGDRYQHTLRAMDVDSFSSFGYHYSFTPRAPWLENPTITKTARDGGGTNLTVQFDGVADKPASYLVNVMIWDGYNGNTRSQSWVINVSPGENDIPQVNVTSELEGKQFEQLEKVTVRWSGSDRNQIVGYKLYITSNPADQESWVAIDESIPHTRNSYEYEIPEDLEPGNYQFIIEATDNQTPPATGRGTSGQFTVTAASDPDEDDKKDEKPSDGPQVGISKIEMIYPKDGEEITDAEPTIKAKLTTPEGVEIITSSVSVKLNDEDVSESVELEEISEREATLSYKVEEPLDDRSENKLDISFEDSEADKTELSANFMVRLKTAEDEIEILGLKLSKRLLIIGAIILIIVVFLALLIPYLLYKIISPKDSIEPLDNDDYKYYKPSDYKSYNTPVSATGSSSSYTAPKTTYSPNDYYADDSYKKEEVSQPEPAVAKSADEEKFTPAQQPSYASVDHLESGGRKTDDDSMKTAEPSTNQYEDYYAKLYETEEKLTTDPALSTTPASAKETRATTTDSSESDNESKEPKLKYPFTYSEDQGSAQSLEIEEEQAEYLNKLKEQLEEEKKNQEQYMPKSAKTDQSTQENEPATSNNNSEESKKERTPTAPPTIVEE